jgi:hypothetical protein
MISVESLVILVRVLARAFDMNHAWRGLNDTAHADDDDKNNDACRMDKAPTLPTHGPRTGDIPPHTEKKFFGSAFVRVCQLLHITRSKHDAIYLGQTLLEDHLIAPVEVMVMSSSCHENNQNMHSRSTCFFQHNSSVLYHFLPSASSSMDHHP